MKDKYAIPKEILDVDRPNATVVKTDGQGNFYVKEAKSVRTPGKSYPNKIYGNVIGKIIGDVYVPYSKSKLKDVSIKERNY
jgi:hypothetical protein